MKTLVTAAAGAIALAAVLTGSALAWGSRIEGRPASFEAGSEGGVYFWHEADDGLHLRTTDARNIDHYYTGTITTDGTFYGLNPVSLEQDDTASVDPSGHTLTFAFHTYAGVDGIDYFIDGGSQQTLDLQVDGHRLSPSRVFLGEDSVNPDRDPFTLLRNP
jgi:hypothetical protein